MTDSFPLVSVVMITYNGLPWLKIAVESVLATTGVPIELVVVDDCSTDDSRQYLKKASATDPRVRPLFLPENLGISGARNAGLDAARGEYVSLVDSDDRFLPDTVSRQLESFARLRTKAPDLSLLTSEAWLINEAGERKGRYFPKNLWGMETTENPPLWTLPSTFFFRRDHSARFHPAYRSADAPIFISRMMALGPIGFFGEPLIEYRLRMSSVTNVNGTRMLREMGAAEMSKRMGRLDNPVPPEEVPMPTWRVTTSWVCGRNSKAAAANGRYFLAATELAKAMVARPSQTLEKLMRVFRSLGKRTN